MSMRTKLPEPAACADDGLEVLAAELVGEVEPERGELDADVGVEAAALDLGEDVAVGLGDRARVLLAGDLLAEDVDGRELPLRVQARARRRPRRAASSRRCSGTRRAGRPASERPAAGERWRGRAASRARRLYAGAADRTRPGVGHRHETVTRPGAQPCGSRTLGDRCGHAPVSDTPTRASRLRRASVTAVVGTGRRYDSRMNPWRAALTSATASGKRTRIASRMATACSSTLPCAWICGERSRRQLDRRVQGQRRELLALRLLHVLGLLLGELAQPAHQVLRVTPERESEASTFHAPSLAAATAATAQDSGPL